MAQFVLVHGAWHGAWCWRKVLPILRAAGHEVHAVSLTGVGEKAHLISPQIRLSTHIQDVQAIIEHEELNEVILVGHSYAGMVITGVADHLLQHTSPVLKQLVYLDAVTPHSGESWSSRHSAETQAARRAIGASTGEIALPATDGSSFGLNDSDLAWVNRRLTAQPFGVYDDPLFFDEKWVSKIPRTFIDCVSPALATIKDMRERVRLEAGWQVVELQTGHDAMISAPDALSQALLALV